MQQKWVGFGNATPFVHGAVVKYSSYLYLLVGSSPLAVIWARVNEI